MQVYWVRFSNLPAFSGLGLGAGVTAHDVDEAIEIVKDNFGQLDIATLDVVQDIASLDEGHVRPNMGSIFLRGVWFPLGYEPVGTPGLR